MTELVPAWQTPTENVAIVPAVCVCVCVCVCAHLIMHMCVCIHVDLL